MPRSRRWSDEELRTAVEVSRTLADVCRLLGVPPGGRTYASIRRHMDALDIDPARSRSATREATSRKRPTEGDLRAAVNASSTYAETLRRLGYRPSGGMHRWLKAKITLHGISTEHMMGRGWSRGRRVRSKPPVPLGEILVVNSSYGSGRLRQRLINAGLKDDCCEGCGLDSWLGQPIALALDHINGCHTDNRLANLRILCPNCHALTNTWCGRNIGRRTPMQRDQT